MKSYKEFMNFTLKAQTTKKCPEGYRFDEKLKVCVPTGVTRYYPYYGNGSSKQTDTSNNNGQNGNGSNGNGASGDNNNTGNGNGGNGQ